MKRSFLKYCLITGLIIFMIGGISYDLAAQTGVSGSPNLPTKKSAGFSFPGPNRKERQKKRIQRRPARIESARHTSVGKRRRVRSNRGINPKYASYNQPKYARKDRRQNRKGRQYVSRSSSRRFTLFGGGGRQSAKPPRRQKPLQSAPRGYYGSGGDDLIKSTNVTRYNQPAERTLNDYNDLESRGTRVRRLPIGRPVRGPKRRIVTSSPAREEYARFGGSGGRSVRSTSSRRVQMGNLKSTRKSRFNYESSRPRFSKNVGQNDIRNQSPPRAEYSRFGDSGPGGSNMQGRRSKRSSSSRKPLFGSISGFGQGRPTRVNNARPSDIDGRNIRWSTNSANVRRVNPDTEGRRSRRQRNIYSVPISGSIARPSTQRGERAAPASVGGVSSISGTIRNRKPRNIYAMKSQSRKGERFTNKDIAGFKLRTKNAESERPSGFGPIPMSPYATGWRPRTNKEQRASKIKPTVNVSSISGTIRNKKPKNLWAMGSQSRKGERSTNRDIAGFKLRTRGARSPVQSITVRPTPARSATPPGEVAPYPPFSISNYSISPRGETPWKGDVSRRKLRTRNARSVRPQGMAYPRSRPPSGETARATGFIGGMRANPGYLYGESIWRGDNRIGSKPGPPGYARFGGNRNMRKGYTTGPGSFSGYQRSRRALTGGGSISGRIRNNGGNPIAGRGPGPSGFTQFGGNRRPSPGYSTGPGSYSGNLRARRYQAGGGSVKPRLRNNGGSPIAGRGAGPSNYTMFGGNQRQRPGFSTGPGSFSGNLRYKPYPKGGGSVKPRLRNNGGSPIAGRGAGPSDYTRFGGNQRQRKGFSTGFGNFQGNLRLRKEPKGGGSVKFRLHNNGGVPLQKDAPGLGTALATRYQGNLRSNRIPKPDRSYEGYQGNMKAKDNPAINTDYVNFQGRYRLSSLVPGYNMSYVNYSGNTKVKRGSKKGKHPSFYYEGIRGNSVHEKDKVINFKLMWSKIFKKNENRPKHLDEKVNPRYSRDEAQIWYE